MGDVALQRIELVLFEQVRDFGAIVAVQRRVFQLHVEGHVRLDGDQFLAEGDVGTRGYEHIPLLLGQGVDIRVDILQGTIFRDQFAGPDLADALDARDVVRSVSADGEHVDDLLRPVDPVTGADLRYADDFVIAAGTAGLVLPDMVGDQLTVILVRRHHIDIHALGRGFDGHRADHVVRLVVRYHQDRDVHRPAYLDQRIQGVDDELGRLGTVGLIGGVHAVAEGPARRVEGNGQMGRPFALDQFEQILRETEQDGGIQALRVDHRTPHEGVVHLEDKGVSVYEKQSSWHNFQR